jgi:hypothetical protein
VLGLWKGDLTLKRAIVQGLEAVQHDGSLARILARYLGEGPVQGRQAGILDR